MWWTWHTAWMNAKANLEMNNWQAEIGVFVPCSCSTVLSSLMHSPLLYSGCRLFLTPFPLPVFFWFFCYSSTQRPQTYQELPGTHLGKLAKPSFPFNCFAWGQISLKMLKVPYSNLIIRNDILRFNGAWMQKKKKKVWESSDKISRIRFFAPQCTSFRLRSVLSYHFTFRGPHIFTIPAPQQPACVITQAILT